MIVLIKFPHGGFSAPDWNHNTWEKNATWPVGGRNQAAAKRRSLTTRFL